MFFHSLEYKRVIIAVFACLLLMLSSSPQLLSQENWQNRTDSKYSFEEEPSIILGPRAGDLKVGPGMNAVGKRLKGSKFVGQDMQGSVFDGCDLDGVWFVECDLSRASFKGACLTGAHIEGSGIDGADFTDAVINGAGIVTVLGLSEEQLISTHSYKTKNLRDCVISAGGIYPEFSDKPLVKYDFRKANLSQSLLNNGDFSKCDFTDASIGGMRLSNARITAEQLASTSNYKQRRLRYMKFWRRPGGPDSRVISGRVDFSGINLKGTSFRGRPLDADFSGAMITRCSFDKALTKEQLCSTKNYREGNLVKIRLFGIDLSGCDLSSQNLTGCSFQLSNLSRTNFENAVITDVNFGKTRGRYMCNNLTPAQIKSTWNYKNGRMAGVELPDELADALKAEEKLRRNGKEKAN